ncbi:ATP-binding protein [Streptomyces sp. NPDC058755]|uniref:ATP-binding protein n=1 Tax=Streptomyces sp. NPDC058755 TaxID=3346624 RepID=UPI0036BE1118
MSAARQAAIGIGYSDTLPCEAESARRARQLVTDALNRWGIDELVDSGALIVSELFTNSVDHTRDRVARVVVRRVAKDRIRIGVADRSREAPEMTNPDEHSENGRGLAVIDALADRWGYDLHGWGKVTWAELRVRGGESEQ